MLMVLLSLLVLHGVALVNIAFASNEMRRLMLVGFLYVASFLVEQGAPDASTNPKDVPLLVIPRRKSDRLCNKRWMRLRHSNYTCAPFKLNGCGAQS
jgi:hypothetical protein